MMAVRDQAPVGAVEYHCVLPYDKSYLAECRFLESSNPRVKCPHSVVASWNCY